MPDDPTLSPIRIRVAQLALSYVGKDAHDAEYRELIAPFDSPKRQEEIATESSCILALLGYLRQGGYTHELLAREYVDSKAPEWLFAIAREAKALRTAPFKASDFVVGNFVIVDGFDASLHGYAIVESVPDPTGIAGELAVVSVDGGQREADRTECIEQIERVVLIARGVATDRRESPPPRLVRKVTHIVDLDALFESNDPYASETPA